MSANYSDSNAKLIINCFDDNTLFLLTNLIEKFLPAGWQSLLEESLPIKPPDTY